MTNLIEKVTPQNIDAERSVLGSCLLDKNAVIKALEILGFLDFYVPNHQVIFKVIKDLYNKNQPIDLITVSNFLRNENYLADIGGYSYLIDLSESVPTTANIEFYCNIVKEKSSRRQLINAASEITNLAYFSTEKIEDIFDKSQAFILGIGSVGSSDDMKHISELIHQEMELTMDAKENGITNDVNLISTGIGDLDRALDGGLNPSDLIIIAARPGIGKSALTTNIAVNVAKTGRSAGIINLEMPNKQTVQRIIAADTEIALGYIKARALNDIDFDTYLKQSAKLAEIPLYLDDKVGVDINVIKTKARKLKSKCARKKEDGTSNDLGVLVVDYLQLIDMDSDNEVRELMKISKELKKLAKELNITIILLCQLNRELEKRQNKRPQLSDLKGAGVEADADIVISIYRDEIYNPDTDDTRIAELNILKYRNGQTGMFKVYFDGKFSKFSSLELN